MLLKKNNLPQTLIRIKSEHLFSQGILVQHWEMLLKNIFSFFFLHLCDMPSHCESSSHHAVGSDPTLPPA